MVAANGPMGPRCKKCAVARVGMRGVKKEDQKGDPTTVKERRTALKAAAKAGKAEVKHFDDIDEPVAHGRRKDDEPAADETTTDADTSADADEEVLAGVAAGENAAEASGTVADAEPRRPERKPKPKKMSNSARAAAASAKVRNRGVPKGRRQSPMAGNRSGLRVPGANDGTPPNERRRVNYGPPEGEDERRHSD